MVEQVADELDVVYALVRVAGALPGRAVGALDALWVDSNVFGGICVVVVLGVVVLVVRVATAAVLLSCQLDCTVDVERD